MPWGDGMVMCVIFVFAGLGESPMQGLNSDVETQPGTS